MAGLAEHVELRNESENDRRRDLDLALAPVPERLAKLCKSLSTPCRNVVVTYVRVI